MLDKYHPIFTPNHQSYVGHVRLGSVCHRRQRGSAHLHLRSHHRQRVYSILVIRLYQSNVFDSPVVRHIGSTMLMGGLGPRLSALLLSNGVVVCQEDTGAMHNISLASHEHAATPTMPNEKVIHFVIFFG